MRHSINKLELSNFRNYLGNNHEFEFHKNLVVIVGPNGSGKSNLLEAIQFVSYGAESSEFADKRLLSINGTEDFFSINCNYSIGERSLNLKTAVGQGHKKISINDVKYRSLKNAIEDVPKVVTFKARESIEIIRGAPQKRREWLDTTISLLNVTYRDALKTYNKVLMQRNALLQSYQHRQKSYQQLSSEIEPWNLELAKYAVFIESTRTFFCNAINKHFKEAYLSLVEEKDELASLLYVSTSNSKTDQGFLEQLKNVMGQDLARGQTCIGPHRDDIDIELNNKTARHYASQGQKRCLALALKITQLEKWKEELDYSPILLLDDVVAELDLSRQDCLMKKLLGDWQVFLTTTHIAGLPFFLQGEYQLVNLKNN